MNIQYTFTVIRYVHDVVGGEFVNVGIVLYAPAINFIDVICNKRYGRLSKLFVDVDGQQFRSVMNFLETSINTYQYKLEKKESEFQFDSKPKNVIEILKTIISQDDSTLQFSPFGSGFTTDVKIKLEELYKRFVERYDDKPIRICRDEEDVWRTYKKSFDEKRVSKHFKRHKITTKDFEYEFQNAWKNGQWRMLEPISFDLEEPNSITDKATKWLGRAVSLADSRETFTLCLLIGKPQKEALLGTYVKAENILNKMPVSHEIIHEDQANDFAENIKREIEVHGNEE